MILQTVENIGGTTIKAFSAFYGVLEFALLCILDILNPSSYNPKMRASLIHQIYYTSIVVIPIFSLIAFFFGSIIIGIVISVATEFNLQISIGSIIVNFVINEFSPMFTALFIALRSATLISKKISLTDTNNDAELMNNIILPRIISGMLSTLSLSILFSIIMIMSGYVFIYFFIGMDFHTYQQLLFDAITIKNIFILLLKSTALGFFTILIPIYSGLQVSKNKLKKKISLIDTLIKLFFAIFFIEMFSLLLIALLEI